MGLAAATTRPATGCTAMRCVSIPRCAAAAGVGTSESTVTLLSNSDGQPVASAADAMEKLVAQLTRPVRWDLCNDTIRQREVAAIVEFPPAGTLVGIAKRELKGTPTYAVKTPADLDGLAEL